MIAPTEFEQPVAEEQSPTLWGLTPEQLHARYWKSRGIQIVSNGSPGLEINRRAEIYLLVSQSHLVIMQMQRAIELLSWLNPDLLMVRLGQRDRSEYREVVEARADGHFLRFRREYESWRSRRQARVALTTNRELAMDWATMDDEPRAWAKLRQLVPADLRAAIRSEGRIYRCDADFERSQYVRDLAGEWVHPQATISRIRKLGNESWVDADAAETDPAALTGPIWIGAGRSIPRGKSGVGPAVLWDDPKVRPDPDEVEWRDIEAIQTRPERRIDEAATYTSSSFKRAFDVVFALMAIVLTLPLYPFIIAAIWIEDRSPIFFAHERESINGKEFGCLKFRTMYRNAEDMKAELQAENKADGPQFFMEKDPRITKVGAVLRKLQLDELPQFINVLMGHMSVVGPRPSPFSENQLCPGWREARLSVRPGVTGLWQIRRTRADGADFQEWIRYDIEYVEKATFLLDLYIIWRTIGLVLAALSRR
jgi:lipopolysaccharide/colanic/teichoic acid biosynthesis glycosyltransferase